MREIVLVWYSNGRGREGDAERRLGEWYSAAARKPLLAFSPVRAAVVTWPGQQSASPLLADWLAIVTKPAQHSDVVLMYCLNIKTFWQGFFSCNAASINYLQSGLFSLHIFVCYIVTYINFYFHQIRFCRIFNPSLQSLRGTWQWDYFGSPP